MMEVQVVIDATELDCMIEWYRSYTELKGTYKENLDAILNILLMKACIKNGIPFTVKVQHIGGE